LRGSGARVLCEVLTRLAYALATLVMFAAIVGVIIPELALWFTAEFYRGSTMTTKRATLENNERR
jgi:hypothetical protein